MCGALLMVWWFVFVCVCVCGSVCVVMGLDRLIGVSWVCVCVWLCVLNQCQRLSEKERKCLPNLKLELSLGFCVQ